MAKMSSVKYNMIFEQNVLCETFHKKMVSNVLY